MQQIMEFCWKGPNSGIFYFLHISGLEIIVWGNFFMIMHGLCSGNSENTLNKLNSVILHKIRILTQTKSQTHPRKFMPISPFVGASRVGLLPPWSHFSRKLRGSDYTNDDQKTFFAKEPCVLGPGRTF